MGYNGISEGLRLRSNVSSDLGVARRWNAIQHLEAAVRAADAAIVPEAEATALIGTYLDHAVTGARNLGRQAASRDGTTKPPSYPGALMDPGLVASACSSFQTDRVHTILGLSLKQHMRIIREHIETEARKRSGAFAASHAMGHNVSVLQLDTQLSTISSSTL